MPIPKPKSGQSQQDYMGTCMTFLDGEKDKYPEHKQRVAICLDTYKRSNESNIIDRIDTLLVDTTVTGAVATSPGLVAGMARRRKKGKKK